MNQAPSMLKPALISGVAFGVAGAIPFVSALNCFCCALVIGSGMLASFLYSKESRAAGHRFDLRSRHRRPQCHHQPEHRHE
jgi:hypothetical protein